MKNKNMILLLIFAQIVDYFHSFVRPKLNPRLTEFCQQATGISQKQVDAAPDFIQVLESFQEWLIDRRYFTQYRYGTQWLRDGDIYWGLIVTINRRSTPSLVRLFLFQMRCGHGWSLGHC